MAPPLVVVATCPRPGGAQYLERTIDGLERAGAIEFPRVIWHDGGEPPRAPGWLVRGTIGEPSGSRLGIRACLRFARYVAPDRDVLFFEDDLVVAENAVSRLAALEVAPALAFLSAYDARVLPAGARHGVHPVPLERRGGFCGALAVRFPARTIEHLAHADWAATPMGERRHAADVTIGHLCAPRWPLYGILVPNLVDHAGEVSACEHPAPYSARRRAANFPRP